MGFISRLLGVDRRRNATAAATSEVNTSEYTAWRTPFDWQGPGVHPLLLDRQRSYAELYKRPPIYVTISKLTDLGTQVPLKSYTRGAQGRVDGRATAYGQLLASPSRKMSQLDWRKWIWSTYLTWGEGPLYKVRDSLGRPVELVPVHPSRLRFGPSEGGAVLVDGGSFLTEDEETSGWQWWIRRGDGTEEQVLRRDLVLWREWNPHSMHRGMSRLDVMIKTLDLDDKADDAALAYWANGGRPGLALKYGGNFNNAPAVGQRLRDQYQKMHAGPENFARPLILEDGIDAMQLKSDHSNRWLDTGKVTWETAGAVYKIPPPAMGMLERSTFNNVVELHRSLYRDTMPPLFSAFEAVLDFELRDGRFGRTDLQPDFGKSHYAEHLLDGVMRGNFEDRFSTYATAVQNGLLTIAEVRDMENRPFIEGTDTILVNQASAPLDQIGDEPDPQNRLRPLNTSAKSLLMGRLGRIGDPVDIDVDRLVEGLAADVAGTVRMVVASAVANGDSIGELRAAVKGMRI